MKSHTIKDNIMKVDEPWTDMFEIVHCPDIGHDIQLQEKILERFKSGQPRRLDIRCKTPCGKECDYANLLSNNQKPITKNFSKEA